MQLSRTLLVGRTGSGKVGYFPNEVSFHEAATDAAVELPHSGASATDNHRWYR